MQPTESIVAAAKEFHALGGTRQILSLSRLWSWLWVHDRNPVRTWAKVDKAGTNSLHLALYLAAIAVAKEKNG